MGEKLQGAIEPCGICLGTVPQLNRYAQELVAGETEAVKFLNAHGFAFDPPDTFHLGGALRAFVLRDEFIRKFGFAILDKPTIKILKKLSPLLEVGSGSGYWAHELQKEGVDVIATEPGIGKYVDVQFLAPWTKMESLTALEAIKKYPDRTVLTVWPDMDDWAAEMAEAYTGPAIAYVGESVGGCTASEKFFEVAEKKFPEKEEHSISQFGGVHDYLTIYRKEAGDGPIT